jgi:hypothetical protein
MTEITCTKWHITCFNTCLLTRSEVNSFVFFCVTYYFCGKRTVTYLYIQEEYFLAVPQHGSFHWAWTPHWFRCFLLGHVWLCWSAVTMYVEIQVHYRRQLVVFFTIHLPHLSNLWFMSCSCLQIWSAGSCVFSLSSPMCGLVWVYLINIPTWRNHVHQLARWYWTDG